MTENPTASARNVARLPRRALRVVSVALAVAIIVAVVLDRSFLGCDSEFGNARSAVAAFAVLLAATAFLPEAWNRRALLLSVSGILSVALAEVAAEAVFARRFRPPFELDDTLIFHLRPGRTSEFVRSQANGGDRIVYRINSAGFRGAELDRPTGGIRVVVYGDSFIHAAFSQDEMTFAAQLQARLSKRVATGVEVINAGVASYGPDQIALKFERELASLEPDLVVVSVFAGNDFGDLERNKLFRLDDEGRLVANAWTLDPEVACRIRLNHTESILKRMFRRIARSGPGSLPGIPTVDPGESSSAALRFYLERAEAEHEEFAIRKDDVVRNTHVDYFNADVVLRPSTPSALHRLRMMQAVLERVAVMARSKAVRLAFMVIPHPVDVCEAHGFGPIDEAVFPEYERAGAARRLLEIAQRIDVPCLNLYDVFRTERAEDLFFHSGDDHWNDAGQSVAAGAMAGFLVDRGLLEVR